MSEDEVFQGPRSNKPVLQGLFDGGDEWTGRVGALQLDQSAQCSPVTGVAARLESGGVTVQTWVIAAQQCVLGRGATALPEWDGMMTG